MPLLLCILQQIKGVLIAVKIVQLKLQCCTMCVVYLMFFKCTFKSTGTLKLYFLQQWHLQQWHVHFVYMPLLL